MATPDKRTAAEDYAMPKIQKVAIEFSGSPFALTSMAMSVASGKATVKVPLAHTTLT